MVSAGFLESFPIGFPLVEQSLNGDFRELSSIARLIAMPATDTLLTAIVIGTSLWAGFLLGWWWRNRT